VPDSRHHRSTLLALYLALSARAGGYARRTLGKRLAEGKESRERVGERMGEAGAPRPDGRLAWFHAASVGEAMSLLELLRRLTMSRPDLSCLVTTVTVTSAEFVAPRLPERCLHQFVPVDVLPWVERFLDHWRPDLAIWTESEFWPAMLWATHRRGIPMLLINARVSEKSFRRWRGARGMVAGLLQRFDRILAQDAKAERHLLALGAPRGRMRLTGSLKEGAAPLLHDEDERVRLARAFAGRPVWLAASTHEGEEEVVLQAHREVRRGQPMAALILAPRHPVRADGIAGAISGAGWQVARRSKGETVAAHTDVYLADTLGEMGLWYRIAPVSFVGGSLVEVGGHNPFEPALLGSAILHGPHVRNFMDAYRRLHAAGAAVEVTGASSLGNAVVETLAPDRAAEMAAAAWDALSEGAAVTDAVLEVVGGYLDGRG
jgi:3-deoxy-D-manno-octulosonic-acid transferase